MGRCPNCDQVKLNSSSACGTTTGQEDLGKAVQEDSRESPHASTNKQDVPRSKAMEFSDATTLLTSDLNSLKQPLLQRNRRLAVDLAFNDGKPSAWTTFCRAMRNIWSSVNMMPLFLSLAWKDIKKSTCSYCLGFLSVLVVVLICVLMISLLAHMPILFLRLSEEVNGEFDLVIRPGGVMDEATGMNYTAIKEIFPESHPVYGLSAPRLLDAYMALPMRSCPNKRATRMWYNPDGSVCEDIDACLRDCFSNGTALVDLIAIDAAAEGRMGLGTDYLEPAPKAGQVVLSQRAAVLMGGVVVGDTVVLYGNAQSKNQLPFEKMSMHDSAETMMPFKVIAITGINQHKFPGADTFAVVYFHTFLRDVSKGLAPNTSTAAVEGVAHTNPSDCASAVYFTMKPATRLKAYSSTDFNKIRRNVLPWVSDLLAPIGFTQVNRSTPQLNGLRTTRLFSVFLGLVMSIVLVALSFLSIVLIYSILTVGLETKTYELGIQRMIGLRKANLIFLVLTNAYAFTVPAWIFGIGAGQAFYMGARLVFLNTVGMELPILVTGASVGWATLAGFGIPIVASFFPIIALVTQKLPEALNTSRSRNTGVICEIQRKDSARWNRTLFGLGALFFVFGFLVYYLFPTALIAMNLVLMFYIFFGVLIGLLAGFVLLSINFERVAQTCVGYMLLFWERRAVFSLMQKSLSAHRLRNRKTSLMYALSLAFVIFITVVVQIQLLSFTYSARQGMGCEVRVRAPGLTWEDFWAVDELLEEQRKSGIVSAYTYEYTNTDLLFTNNSQIQSLGRSRAASTVVQPLPPNYFEVVDNSFLRVDKAQSIVGRYGLVQSLYTSEGLFKGIMSSGSATNLGVGDAVGTVLLEIEKVMNSTSNDRGTIRTTLRPLATLDAAPVLEASKYLPKTGDLIVSIPSFLRRVNEPRASVLEGNVGGIRLRIKDPGHYGLIGNLLTAKLSALGRSATVKTVADDTTGVDNASNLLNIFFIAAEIMILLICFFSLMSSMTTNVLDSSKEIGVLLCMGMTHFQVYRVFVWEAFILVVSAGIMGLIVGLVVSYTMQLQNVLFTQLPLPFPFPYLQLVILVVLGLVSAVVSSVSPVAYLLGLPSITHILRRTIH
ncbi:hypothetical protein LSCM1_02224 [Leishmania martiniquensis]|uniref:ABC transmembrane type-1 domain-containing protein n=1 Tax=Leishmania martiniquensis TaxID=1580590 RepID=A0A836KC47_9TRYP|nr:hypothetical protein LSCM1_02224 [Leishmania martiniquensis]